MKPKGPYLTLVGGLAVAGVLLALSANAVQKDEDVRLASPASATQTGEDATAAPAEEPTDEPSPEAVPPPEPTPPGTYAGSVKGGGASVAIVIKGGTAIAYVCDGKKVEAWMQGSNETTALSLKGKGGATLKTEYAAKRLSGTIRASGKKWTFKVKPVKAPSGLYRAARNVRSAKVVGGWIVYEGRQVGMVDSDGIETPAPPIDLETGKVTIDGTSIQPEVVDGSPLD